MNTCPVCARPFDASRATDLERMLAEVDVELESLCEDAEAPFLCSELQEFREYLEEELQEFCSAPRG